MLDCFQRVATSNLVLEDDVGGPRIPGRPRSRRTSPLGIQHRIQRLVVDLNEAFCGLRVRQALGDHSRDRLTGKEHLVRRQAPDINRARKPLAGDPRRHRLRKAAGFEARQNRYDTGCGCGRGYIDSLDQRMRMGTSEK